MGHTIDRRIRESRAASILLFPAYFLYIPVHYSLYYGMLSYNYYGMLISSPPSDPLPPAQSSKMNAEMSVKFLMVVVALSIGKY